MLLKKLTDFPERLYFVRVVGTTDQYVHYENNRGVHSLVVRAGAVGAAAYNEKNGTACVKLMNEHGLYTQFELVPCADVIKPEPPQA